MRNVLCGLVLSLLASSFETQKTKRDRDRGRDRTMAREGEGRTYPAIEGDGD